MVQVSYTYDVTQYTFTNHPQTYRNGSALNTMAKAHKQ